MVDVRYVYGGPGCGKTSTLALWARQAAEKRGQDQLLVASFTRAAAHEIGGRDLGGREAGRVGTLHAHCYRALGHPPLVERNRPLIAAWNAQYPEWEMGQGRPFDEGDAADEQAPGDAQRARLEMYRAQLQVDRITDVELLRFRTAWEGFKAEEGVNDFTDLLEQARAEFPHHPQNPSVGILDEAQDCTALELALWWQWAQGMDQMIMGGDPDQAVYGFRGATGRAFLDRPVPADHKHMLPRSYRLPRDVHAYAKDWIAQTRGRREPMIFDHTGKAGAVRFHPSLHIKNGRGVATVLAAATQKYGSVMVLASCAYLLKRKNGIIAALKDQGIPYGNAYAPERTEFNPLHRRGVITAGERVAAYLRIRERAWTQAEFALWAKLVQASEVFQHGKAGAAQALTGDRTMSREEMGCYLRPDAFTAALRGEPSWLASVVPPKARDSIRYPLAVWKQGGMSALTDAPRLTVGTIHSVKGGEADCVLVLPELSPAGVEEWESAHDDDQNAVRRLLYVGMTRAKETLVIGGIAREGAPLPSTLPQALGVYV